MATIILDDSSSALVLSSDRGGNWSSIDGGQFYNGSSVYAPFATDTFQDSGNYAHVTVTFQGTSIACIGHTPEDYYSQNILVSIDGGKPYSTNFGDPSPPSTIQWFQSSLLPDGEHTIQITHIAGASIDYMAITAGQQTPLTGKSLIVDDNDPAIVYSEHWGRNTSRFQSKDVPHTGMPHGNGTHRTTTAGSVAAFPFFGTSIAVYSIFDFSRKGSMVVTFSVDSSSVARTFSVTDELPEHASGVLQRENSLIFAKDNLPATNHTLKIELTSITDQASLVLDYFVYKPSFPNLAAKPNLPAPALSSAVTAPPSTTGPLVTETGIGSPISHDAAPAGTGPSDPVDVKAKNTPIGAIVGGVVGGLALLALFILVLLFRKRLSKRRAPAAPLPAAPTYIQEFPSNVEPFVAMSSVHGSGNKTTGYSYPSSTMLHRNNPDVVWGQSQVSDATTDLRERQQKGFLALSNPGPISPLVPLRRDVSQTNDTSTFSSSMNQTMRSRMQRLQDIMQEINYEIREGRGDSVRVAMLRGRMAELTREDVETERADTDTAFTAMTPPPYEPSRF